MLKLAVEPNMSNEDYHANPAISRSGIMTFLESPYKYWANYLNPARPAKETTKAMEFGSAFHALILEPALFEKTYVMKPEPVFLKDAGREAYEAYKGILAFLEKCGSIILSGIEWEMLMEMQKALQNHQEALALIQGAKYEQSYFWQDKESGLMLKARPDILHDNMIVDLKTCASASSRAYQRTMAESGYHLQGAMIRDAVLAVEGRDIPNVINVCVEKLYPYAIGIKIISEKALEEGRRKYKETLMQMKTCFETDIWPSYEVENVELPTWYT